MCKIMEDLNKKYNYEKQKQIVLAMIKTGKLSYEEIALCTDLTVSEVKTLAEGETA